MLADLNPCRAALIAAASVLAALLVAALAASSSPAAARTVSVRGDIKALALAGDVLYVARQPEGRTLTVERLAPGQPVITVLRTRKRQDAVVLAASADALAVGMRDQQSSEGSEEFSSFAASSSRVLVGPAAGPLREVASCSRSLMAPPVAADGTRLLWIEGGCAEPTARPRGVGPTSVVTGAVDPAVGLQRSPLERNTLAFGLVSSARADLVGIARPTFFFSVDGEVRRVQPGRLGDVLTEEQAAALTPVGLLDDGTAVVGRSAEGEDDEDTTAPDRCENRVFALRSGSSERTPLTLGGCLSPDSDPSVLTAAGERISALIETRGRRRFPQEQRVVSLRGDGKDRRVLARGRFRPPTMIAADPGRVAWSQASCVDGQEVVVADDGPAAVRPRTIAACTAEILTRRALVRAGRITVRVRCRLGCAGVVVDDSRCASGRRLRRFTLRPGTHRLRVRPLPRTVRRGRLLLALRVEHGPTRRRVIKLRR